MAEKKNVLHSRIILIFLCAVFLSMAVGRMYSYLSAVDTEKNNITIGGNRIEIAEDFDPAQEIVPGNPIHKTVRVENKGPNACYVRVKAVFADSEVENYCIVNWNRANWSYEKDGYWYYTEVLSEGEITDPLFTQIQTSTVASQAILGQFEMIVYAESCQAQGFAEYGPAWSHYQENRT